MLSRKKGTPGSKEFNMNLTTVARGYLLKDQLGKGWG